jgi:hypothetical protein
METIDQILYEQRARASVHDDHPDLQLFDADAFKTAHVAILFPVYSIETIDFIRGLREPLPWLRNDDLEAFIDDEKRLERPSYERILAALHASKSGKNKELTQRLFPLKHLAAVLAFCQEKNEHYLSQCSYRKWTRSSGTVNQLTSCWVDLDYYKPSVDAGTATMLDDDAQAIDMIIERCCTAGMGRLWFMPTQIVRSGRGLYIKWIFNHFLPAGAAPRWRHCQDRLVKLFTDFGADPAAVDAARVLRVSGSRNSKSGSLAKVILFGKTIPFDDVASAVLHRQRASQVDREATKQLAEQYRVSAGTGEIKKTKRTLGSYSGASSWPSLAASEIHKLVQMRGSKIRGNMEQATFLIMNFRIMGDMVKSKKDFDQQVKELAKEMGANAGELARRVKNLWVRCEAGKTSYCLSKEKIVKRLSISRDELKHLPCIGKPVGAGAWTEREPPKNLRADLPKLHQRARLLERSGLSLKHIAGELKVSSRTVKRWLMQTL